MPATDRALNLNPDRLLAVDHSARSIARRLYDAARGPAAISPHGPVDPRLLLDNQPSPGPATLFELALDEYLNRRRAGIAVMGAAVPGPWREDRV